MSVIDDLVHLLKTCWLSLWQRNRKQSLKYRGTSPTKHLLTNSAQCFSMVFVRGGQRRFSSIVSVAMSGLKPYTIFAARRCRRSRVFLLVLPRGQKHVSQQLNIGSTVDKQILFVQLFSQFYCDTSCRRRCLVQRSLKS